MPDENSVDKWYYRGKSGSEEGPVDLVEMAGLLRAGDIAQDTLTKTTDDGVWKPFQSRREFPWARDMPAGVIMKHLEIKGTKPESPFTPRRLKYLFGFLGGFSLYILGLILKAYFIGSPTVGGSRGTTNDWLTWLWLHMITHQPHH